EVVLVRGLLIGVLLGLPPTVNGGRHRGNSDLAIAAVECDTPAFLMLVTGCLWLLVSLHRALRQHCSRAPPALIEGPLVGRSGGRNGQQSVPLRDHFGALVPRFRDGRTIARPGLTVPKRRAITLGLPTAGFRSDPGLSTDKAPKCPRNAQKRRRGAVFLQHVSTDAVRGGRQNWNAGAVLAKYR